MARGYQKFGFIGNAGADAETHSFANGGKVANFTVAVTESWKDKDGNKQERTEWMPVVCRNGLADIAAEYVKKGTCVFVEGRLRTRQYTDKNSVDRTVFEIHCDELRFF